MATHDYVIDNSTGANVRADINNALAAIVSNNSSSSEPSTKYSYMWWADTTNGVLKIRNSANDGWIELLQLDGTLTLEDGSASAPALAFRDDLDTGIFSSGNNVFDIATGGVGRLQIDSSEITFNETGENTDFRIEGDTEDNLFFVDAGNNRIGIGTNSPATALDLRGDLTITSTAPFINFIDSDSNDDFNIQVSGGIFAINNTTDGVSNFIIDSNGDIEVMQDKKIIFVFSAGSTHRGSITADSADAMKFTTGSSDTERMRITGDGHILHGVTSWTTSSGGLKIAITSGVTQLNFSRPSSFTGSQNVILNYHNGTYIGGINTTTSATSFLTSSDYRLKENAVAISDGITRLKTLKAYRFNWKADSSTKVDGFFAHEVTAVPEAITGTKDQVDSDNNPVYQGIDQSKLVPLLTAALQEAISKMEVLETKVAALEAA